MFKILQLLSLKLLNDQIYGLENKLKRFKFQNLKKVKEFGR